MMRSTRFFSPICTDVLTVPGLRVFQNFLVVAQQKELIRASLEFQDKIRSHSQQANKIKARTYLSKQHNLSNDEFYQLIALKDLDHEIMLQYFNTYGEDGHELTYCIGNKN